MAAILLNCIQPQAAASSLADGVVSTDAGDLISPLVKSKLPPNKEGLENLFLEGNNGTEKNLIRLVIRLSDRLVYVYKNNELETTYPIAVGREGWETPTGNYRVIQTIKNPSWQHPFTGEIIPPGPTNPLGARWIGFWTDGTNYIGFHGTPEIETVGTAASHGCVRMYDKDAIALFEKVEIGTPVIVEP
ncbi:MAG: L,D-transpeptidase [Okeania sp. SIO2H7]|nr:L,D-transpeptidase [Okeania sp. SIO2H7]